jgi:glycosyltransferase involved in cell wall biosynthesis
MLISKPPLKIVATLLAHNEADIIGANIEHHVEQGVSQFIITDNRSKDDTKKIAAKYPEVVEIIDEPGYDHHQSKWVTRMARLACKLKPDWIVHLDADELWCGLTQLRHFAGPGVASTKMYLHPPNHCDFNLHDLRYYLDLENTSLPGEAKVMHRPDPDIVITHGNHGFEGDVRTEFTKEVWRHHYPVRSLSQFTRKAVEGHEALLQRNSICERWQKWYNLHEDGKLGLLYDQICDAWTEMIVRPNTESLIAMLDFWSTPEVIAYFRSSNVLPAIGEWPRSIDAK